MNRYFTSIFSSPVGNLRLIGSEQALMALLWSNDRPERVPLPTGLVEHENEVLTKTKKQLAEYFEGKRQRFDLPLHMVGTDFQKLVWQQLQNIPFGQTRTYGQLAKNLNQPTASRAVGAANGRNPISIIVPCHRVIGSNASLTGFAGGTHVKQQLLKHEGHPFLL